ncbi:MAG TPA: glycosyltransferase family 2 protein, partial [candidate division Zixibacteria bacterium]|nr:glycosyltransferase family 2 protein [candidate division Zixibacteria bacterium]
LITTALPEVTVVNERDNRGFAGGCNRAVARARGEYLLFLNPDVYLDEGTMGALVSELRRRPDAGAVVGRMRDPSGAFQPTCRQLPTRANIFLSRGSVLSRAFGSMGYTLPDFPTVTAVPAAAATCWLMPRTLFEDVGGFDERFFMFMEDTDLSLRIALAGKKIYFVPHAGAEHAWGAGASATEQQRVRWHSQSVLAYYQKRFPGLYSRLVLPLALKLNQALRRALG